MTVAVSIANLRSHLLLLNEELENIKAMETSLLRWQEKNAVDVMIDPAFFRRQRQYVYNQKNWINNRISLIEKIIEKFGSIQVLDV